MYHTQEQQYFNEAMVCTSTFCKILTHDTSTKGKHMFEECCETFKKAIMSLETKYEKKLVTMMGTIVGDDTVCNFNTEYEKIFTKDWSDYTKHIFSEYIYNLTNILFLHNENFLNNYQKTITGSIERMFKNEEIRELKMREFDGKMCLLYANYRFIIGELVKNMIEQFDNVITQLSYKSRTVEYRNIDLDLDLNSSSNMNLYETA